MSPFSGIPRGDRIHDVLAGIALILSLALVWSADGMGYPRIAASRVDVLLVTLVSLLSLALPYLARVGVLPATWTVVTIRNARVLANAPYALLVLVHYVISLTNDIQYLGAAVPVGLAGAVLAAQPRLAELGPRSLDAGIGQSWMRAFAAVAGVGILTTVVGFLLSAGESFAYFSLTIVLQLLALAALVIAPLAVAAHGVLRRSGEWAIALGVLGAAIAVGTVLGGGYFPASSVLIGLVFLPAAGAIAASPVLRRVLPESNGPELWLGAAVRVLELVILIAGVQVLLQVFSLFSWMTGVTALRLVVNVLIIVGAVVARSALKGDPLAARSAVLGVAGGIAIAGLVVWVVVATSEYESLTAMEGALYFLLPAAVVALLTAPASVRAFFPARSSNTHSWAGSAAGGAAAASSTVMARGPRGQHQDPAWPQQAAGNPAESASAPAAWLTPVGEAGGPPSPWSAQPASAPLTSTPSGSVPAAVPAMNPAAAAPSTRVAALMLDGLAGGALSLVATVISVAVLGGAVSVGSDSAMLAGLLGLYFIPSLVIIAFGIAQLVWEGRQGLTVGNKIMGIRTVTFDLEEPPGFGRAFVRRLIEGLGGLVIVGGLVIAASAAWDEPTRRQGWQDKIAGTEMILLRGAGGTAVERSTGRASWDTPAPAAPPAPATEMVWPKSEGEVGR